MVGAAAVVVVVGDEESILFTLLDFLLFLLDLFLAAAAAELDGMIGRDGSMRDDYYLVIVSIALAKAGSG